MTFDNHVGVGGEAVTAGGRIEHRWEWHRGGEFAVGTWVRNDGRLPIRVTGMEPLDTDVPWDGWRVTLGNADLSPGDRALRPFALRPSESRLVWIRGDFRRCPESHGPGTKVAVSHLVVSFEVAGVPRREIVDVGFTYSVEIPQGGC